jgi:CCR4-NOT transcription complex subunit 3
MEKFKAVEKEMKTKAYSKEGLSAAAKLDPKEKEKLEACQFLNSMVEELERQIETLEAEAEALQANLKKGKRDTSKADRVAEIERLTERHKWHQGKLELMLRSLENGGLETEQVTGLQEDIKNYVDNNQDVDFFDDDGIYDDLNLSEEEDIYGMNNDNDRVSSQDTQSIQDDAVDIEVRGASVGGGKSKSSSISEPPLAARRPSTQMKSPLPALATLHTPLSSAANSNMKPAPLPTRPAGETLKYSSAAAAAAASDKNGVGIAPLPPPPGVVVPASSGLVPLPPVAGGPKSSSTTSPNVAHSLPTSAVQTPGQRPAVPASDIPSSSQAQAKSPALSHSGVAIGVSVNSSVPQTPALEVAETVPRNPQAPAPAPAPAVEVATNGNAAALQQTNESETMKQINMQTPEADQNSADVEQPGPSSRANGIAQVQSSLKSGVDESIYHLPPGLQDLIQSFETTKNRVSLTQTQTVHRLLSASQSHCPESVDAEKPRHYKPQTRYDTPKYYPQEPLPIFNDPELYSQIDTDTLFYVFYYRQGTYQQYLAAKALKSQSWRFHKQYQTWFQRHEEPKTITDEFEQGTYRFFDYESTWSVCRTSDI